MSELIVRMNTETLDEADRSDLEQRQKLVQAGIQYIMNQNLKLRIGEPIALSASVTISGSKETLEKLANILAKDEKFTRPIQDCDGAIGFAATQDDPAIKAWNDMLIAHERTTNR